MPVFLAIPNFLAMEVMPRWNGTDCGEDTVGRNMTDEAITAAMASTSAAAASVGVEDIKEWRTGHRGAVDSIHYESEDEIQHVQQISTLSPPGPLHLPHLDVNPTTALPP